MEVVLHTTMYTEKNIKGLKSKYNKTHQNITLPENTSVWEKVFWRTLMKRANEVFTDLIIF